MQVYPQTNLHKTKDFFYLPQKIAFFHSCFDRVYCSLSTYYVQYSVVPSLRTYRILSCLPA